MGSFFGNIQNAERTQLRFDKIYPNRKAMEDGLKNGDGVFVGRFVLIEYDDNVSARRLAYYDKVEYPFINSGSIFSPGCRRAIHPYCQ